MKKCIVMFLVLVCGIALLTGCCMSHEWVDASCEAPKTCTNCDKTEGEALGHTWADASCTAPKTCTVCGKTEGEALAHNWSEADCVTAKTCSLCGSTEGEALGHSIAWQPDSEDFYKMTGTCSACGETQTCDVDWEKISGSFVTGSWNLTYMSTDGRSLQSVEEGSYFEIREDGTATLLLEGTEYAFNWSYRTSSIPDDNFLVANIVYNFGNPELNPRALSLNYSFGRETTSMFLYIGSLVLAFSR